ncbi:3-ketoacyl-ACP reductase [Sphingobium sp. TA15]|uniref:SDR-family protein n=1 Tax=Sphingobium indicum (strain DSM 16413 / CCM 7287 / MTCC 6362 / UT26 / NBRC 101211 / UT26S) TaxID=452662 RepID=D4Z280_SPHIU|nr:SDR family NAD(P)-dependent oxidoreductase [Sphingobium indicum]BAI96712.1 SDR-family protein [Sphingobium indicum UT26S]BDD66147.1 3-ketoacyl-ACP reductase [Sphingobium sp. TA15]
MADGESAGRRRIAGKTAIVTGAAEGLGRAIALRFAEEGAKVALIDMDGEGLDQVVNAIRTAGGEATGLVADATEEESAVRLVSETLSVWETVDILVNNVGGARVGRVWDMPVEDWDFTMRLNLRPTFLFSKHVLPHMIARRSGRVICMSSGAREGTPWTAYYAGGAAYSTTKAGVHGFIRDLSLEVAEYGITVNAVAPGPINTARAGPPLRAMDESGLPYSPSRMTPLGRLGEPVEIAHAALFLASDEAAYITGTTVHVTGGR